MKRKQYYFSVHFSFWCLAVFSIIFDCFFLLLEYFICLVLHELIHALVAKKLGYKIGKIKLQATGATLEADNDEFSFSDEILISISGPLFNLCFALLIVVCWWIKPEVYNYTQDLFVVNLSLCLFNLVPIFPLDGGRVLLAVFSKKLERRDAVKISRLITLIFCLLLFSVFVFSLFSTPNFGLGVMSVVLLVGGISEDKQARYKRVLYLPRKLVRIKKLGVEAREIYVSEDIDKSKLLKMLNARFYTNFVFVDDNFKKVSSLSEAELIDSVSRGSN